MYSKIEEKVKEVGPIEKLSYIAFLHFEADECRGMELLKVSKAKMICSDLSSKLNLTEMKMPIRSYLILGKRIIENRQNDTQVPSDASRTSLGQHALLSVHTLEIGYDVPEVGIEIILATTSNMNQVIQRIGRVVRVYQGKRRALIYVVYISETRDDRTLQIFREAIKFGGRPTVTDEVEGGTGEQEKRRMKQAYNILEVNSYEPVIVETDREQKLYLLRSSKDKNLYTR